ncbi:MAG: DJ-1/PfpI family protein, partial [Planctomycetota bacterium]
MRSPTSWNCSGVMCLALSVFTFDTSCMAKVNERTGSPTALILVAEGGEEIETYAPADVLVRAGFDVMLAGVSGLSPTGSRGLPMR